MNLIIDAGNTVLKAAVCEGITIGKTYRYQGEKKIEYVRELAEKIYPQVTVLCSARTVRDDELELLKGCAGKIILIDPEHKSVFRDSEIPDYLTPDALAGVKAALHMFKGRGCSIFDFGTTITSTFINEKGGFEGSAISPGCTTRFRSISRYARNLPLLSETELIRTPGDSLESSVRCGVVSGIMFEIEGYINKYADNMTIFTGGDANYFAKRTKNSIFVVCNLVLMGLALIAQENENLQ